MMSGNLDYDIEEEIASICLGWTWVMTTRKDLYFDEEEGPVL